MAAVKTHEAGIHSTTREARAEILTKQVVVVNRNLGLDYGKFGSQVGKAAQRAYKAAQEQDPSAVEVWDNNGQKLIILGVDGVKELKRLAVEAKAAGLPHVRIVDKGLTVVNKGTFTAIGIGPAEVERVDEITGALRTY